jgi:hypothetical protein
MVRLGATLIGLDEHAEFVADRQAAIAQCLETSEPRFIDDKAVQ